MLKLVKVYFFMSVVFMQCFDVQAAAQGVPKVQPKKWYEDLNKLQSVNRSWCFGVSTYRNNAEKSLIVCIEDTALSEQAVLQALQKVVAAYNFFHGCKKPKECKYYAPEKRWCYCKKQKVDIVYSLES